VLKNHFFEDINNFQITTKKKNHTHIWELHKHAAPTHCSRPHKITESQTIQQLLKADSRDSWQFVTCISVILSWSKMAVLAETTRDTFHEPFSFSTHSNPVQVIRNEAKVIFFLIYFLKSWLFKTFLMFPAFKNLSQLSASTSFVYNSRKIPRMSS